MCYLTLDEDGLIQLEKEGDEDVCFTRFLLRSYKTPYRDKSEKFLMNVNVMRCMKALLAGDDSYF